MRDAVGVWAGRVASRPRVRAVGLFGSLVDGPWGVGSDVDLVVVVDASDEPVTRRALAFPTDGLPVPADVLVYTDSEWAAGPRIGQVRWLSGSADRPYPSP